MNESRRSNIVIIKRPRRPKHKHSSVKTRRTNTVVHVTIGSSKSTSSNKKISHLSNSKAKTPVSEKIVSQSGNLNYLETQQNTEKLTDRKGTTNNHHQSLKRKRKHFIITNKRSLRRCFIVCFVLTVLLVLIASIVLVLCLWKSAKRITPTPNLTAVLRWNKTGITVAGITRNSGTQNDQLNTPLDVILDYANNLYIADSGNNRVQKYLYGASIGQTICGNGTAGLTAYQLSGPSRIIFDSNENLYISERYNSRVQLWLKGANSGTTVAGTGSAGPAYNQLYGPYGIVLNPDTEMLYVLDMYNSRIMSYAYGATNGSLVFGSTQGLSNTQLCHPAGLHLDPFSNGLVIANHEAHNIVRYVFGATNWNLILGNTNGAPGSTSTTLRYPVEATFDPMGNMYVADKDNNRIQFVAVGELNGTTIAGITGVSDSNATTLFQPWSVRLDSQLNLYVPDSGNQRIQKFLRF